MLLSIPCQQEYLHLADKTSLKNVVKTITFFSNSIKNNKCSANKT